MSFPRYPKYKPSGVEWLGEVPAHWAVLQIKRIARLQSGDSIPADSIREHGMYPVFGGNGLRGYTDGFTHEGAFVLIGRQGALCGNVNYAHDRFWASEHAVVAHPVVPLETRWLGELLRTMNLNQYSTSAAQPGLAVEAIAALRTVMPPFSEQRAIASFLDRETAKIDALIAEQEKLIELLAEKRQAVISHAVTKGLDPAAPMKPSGVEWLGEVPEHWGRSALKRMASYENGYPYKPEERGLSGLPIIRISQLTSEDAPALYAGSLEGHVPIANGELLFSWSASIDAYIWSRGDALLNQHIFKVVPAEGVDRDYLFHLIRHVAPKLADFDAHGSTMRHIKKESLGEIAYLPTLVEQRAIAAFLDRETAKIDGLVAEAEKAVELLRERRSALISAAVTGQIDVRHTSPELVA